MIEDSGRTNARLEHEVPGSQEISSAKDLLHSLLRTAKGLKMYLPNNPVLIKFTRDLDRKMAAHIALYGDLELEVGLFILTYKAFTLYQNEDPKESLAFRMFSDGIRLLRFEAGVEARELTDFLEIVGFERPNCHDDDIVTRLWEVALPHVTYLLAEDFDDFDLDEEEETDLVSQRDAIALIFADLAELSDTPTGEIPKQLLMLTAEEVEWLREVKLNEAQRNPLDDVVAILSAILAGSKEPELFADFIVIVGNLSVNLLLAGETGTSLRLIRILDRSLKQGNPSPEHRQLILKALAGVLCEKSIGALQLTLDGRDSFSQEELRELLQILGLPAIGPICELLGRVEKLKMRKVIIEVLVGLGGNDPQVFAPFLSDPRWFLVRNVVLVLSQLDTPVALEMIAGLISSKEPRIRKEVLGFLERSPDPKAKNYLLKFLRDESSALRIRALQILAREKQNFALKPALSIAAADDFKTRDLAEKKAVYESLAELDAEQMMPVFREMLRKKRWFRKNVDKDTAVCAVSGLLKIMNHESLRLLHEARKHHSPEIRGVIEQAISAIAVGA